MVASPRGRKFARIVFSAAIAGFSAMVPQIPAAQAAKIRVLHDFCCVRSFSTAGLLLDASGNLYGTWQDDGTENKGTIFKLSPDAQGKTWSYAVLHDFCSAQNCADGSDPFGGLIIDTAGNIYGTAESGGNTNHGVAFEVTAGGTYNILYSFCADDETCADGSYPVGALTYAGAGSGAPYDGSSPLYGAGSVSSGGLVFELSPNGQSQWSATTIFDLGSAFGENCDSDGVAMDDQGNLVGTTMWCGNSNMGMAFVLSDGDQGWTQAAQIGFDSHYRNPRGTLIEDAEGMFYGTAEYGGKKGVGAVFRLKSGHRGLSVKTLQQFNEKDGSHPQSGVVADAAGNLFGTTTGGGKGEGGTVFELSGKSYQVIYNFCLHDKCRYGSDLLPGVVLDSKGNIYGISTQGGADGYGTVYEITP